MINILDLAPRGHWLSGELSGKHNFKAGTTTPIRFGGSTGDARGFVRIDNVRMEDGSVHKALRMHPKWVQNGAMKGWLPFETLPSNAMFTAKVGFLSGARNTDGVRFSVWAHTSHNGRTVWSRVLDFPKTYTEDLVEVSADLSHLSGKRVRLELRVDVGDGIGYRTVPAKSGQDWAAWVDPKITSGGMGRAMVMRTEFTRIKVNKSDDGWFGDEPYIGAIYFRTVVGRPGGTKVVVLDSLDQLGDDMKDGDSEAITKADNLWVHDVVNPTDFGELLSGQGKGLTVFGMGFVAVEEDGDFRHHVRPQLQGTACSLRQELLDIELLEPEEAIKQLASLADRFADNRLAPCRLPTFVLSGGGIDIGDVFKFVFGGSADDQVGSSAAIFSSVTERAADGLKSFGDAGDGDLNRQAKAAAEAIAQTTLFKDGAQITKRLRAAEHENDWSITLKTSKIGVTERLTTGF
ncbi:MAG: hypothetical protein AAGI03_13680 [Pseudomonadota bacterium]